MIALLLALLSIQTGQTVFPDSFRTANMYRYINCVRIEAKGSGDPEAGPIMHFSQLISLCGEERSRWANELRGLIRTRHPDWTPEKLSEAVEFVISDFELELLNSAHKGPMPPTHSFPEPRF